MLASLQETFPTLDWEREDWVARLKGEARLGEVVKVGKEANWREHADRLRAAAGARRKDECE